MMKKYVLTVTLFFLSLIAFSQSHSNPIEVYPNPFKEKVTIKVNATIQSYRVYDVLGKQILETQDVERLKTLLLKLRSGIYLIKVTDASGNVHTKKLLKQ